MNRDVLNRIIDKCHIKCINKISYVSRHMYNLIKHNQTYMQKSHIILSNNNIDDKIQLVIKHHCMGNYYIDLMNFFVEKGVDWNDFLFHGAKYGNIELVNFFIDKGAWNHEDGFKGAACSGSKYLVDFFIKKCGMIGQNTKEYGLMFAAQFGHKNLIDYFIEKGYHHWDMGMYGAICGGHRDLVDFFIEKGADDMYGGLLAATEYGHQDLVNFFTSNNWSFNDDDILCNASQFGHRKLIESYIGDADSERLNIYMGFAAFGGHKDIIEYFIEKGADDWYHSIKEACRGGHTDLVDFLHKKIKRKCQENADENQYKSRRYM